MSWCFPCLLFIFFGVDHIQTGLVGSFFLFLSFRFWILDLGVDLALFLLLPSELQRQSFSFCLFIFSLCYNVTSSRKDPNTLSLAIDTYWQMF